jgi:hypothetical protein
MLSGLKDETVKKRDAGGAASREFYTGFGVVR